MNKTWLLIGGLGLGAGLVYALDPERGAYRRAHARAQVQAYRRRTDHLLDQTRQTLGQQAHRFGRQTREILAQTRLPLGYQRRLGLRQRTFAGVEGVNIGLLILGGIGLGLGLMYLLDPTIGQRRRAQARDRARGYWHRTEDLLNKTIRDTQSRARGVVSGARQRLRGADIPADTALEARVREHIGHVISHPGAIGVTTHQGCVSLSGTIPANEVEKLLATVRAVSGVTEVVNQLEVHQGATHISG
jgi:hypothetical protein